MNNEHIWLNHLRAIATLAVILLHTSGPILNQFEKLSLSNWFIGNLYDSMVRFSVPVFFMISGTLLLNRDYSLKDFIKKRIIRIIPPFIFWSTIYIIYNLLQSDITMTTIGEVIGHFLKELLNGSEYHLWFIYTILGLYLFIPIIRKWIRQASTMEIHFFLIIWCITIIYQFPIFNNYLPKIELVNFSGYLGYMVLGYYLSRTKPMKAFIPFILFILGFLLTAIGTYFLSRQAGTFNGVLYGYLTPNVLLSAISVFLFFKNVKIKSKIIISSLTKINNTSFGIYLMHILVLSVLYEIGVDWQFTYPSIGIPAIAIITLTISTLFIHFASKIKFISKFLN